MAALLSAKALQIPLAGSSAASTQQRPHQQQVVVAVPPRGSACRSHALHSAKTPKATKASRRYRMYKAAAAAETAETSDKAVDEEPQEKGEDSGNGAEVASVSSALAQYRDALQSGDEEAVEAAEAQVAEAISQQQKQAEDRAASLEQELSQAKDRLLRLNADFDNFRKRSDREKLSLATSVRGDVIEDLLPMIDNFERAKEMLKPESEGEVKIDNSYQGIYKQFVEIMKKLGVAAIETVGAPFDPNVHEAIMQEDSVEFEEGIVVQEFRKGFKIDEKVLRPAMVKVSSGPGPQKEEGEAAS